VICMMSKLANNVLNVTLNIKCPKMAPLWCTVSHCDSKEEHLQRKLRHLVTFQLR
jgi:hypothetical protein